MISPSRFPTSPRRRSTLAAAAAFLLTAGAFASGHLFVPVQNARVALPVDTTVRTTCDGSSRSVVTTCRGAACTEVAAVLCAPYGCEAATGLCRSTCVTDGHCQERGSCNRDSGQCVRPSDRCVNAYTRETPGGLTYSCGPYNCRAGRCRSECVTSNDCASGYECRNQHCLRSLN